jgi:hypothetical protein
MDDFFAFKYLDNFGLVGGVTLGLVGGVMVFAVEALV